MARPLNLEICRKLEEMVRTRLIGGTGFLPPERTMAEMLGVGRNVIRNSLFGLERKGIVRLVPSRGWSIIPSGEERPRLKRILVLEPFLFNSKAWELQAILSEICCKAAENFSEAVFSFLDRLADPDSLLDQVRRGELQGIVFLEQVPDPEECRRLQAAGVPCVIANLETDPEGLVGCRMDYHAVGYRAGRRLLEAGHRRIAAVTGDPDRMIFREMLSGFRQALAEEKISIPRSMILPMESSAEEAPALKKILRSPEPPTAVFAMRDCRAALVYRTARECGMNVPGDLSVISYDNISWPAAAEKGLTTFPEDVKQIASGAVEMLRDWSFSGQIPSTKIIAPVLLERTSVRKI